MATKVTTTTKKTTTPKENVVAIKPDVNTQIDALRADIALLADALKLQAKETLNSKTEVARTEAKLKADEARMKYDELTTKAEAQIKENPLTSIAVAVGAGLLLGAIARG